jgi:hypothetical protein
LPVVSTLVGCLSPIAPVSTSSKPANEAPGWVTNPKNHFGPLAVSSCAKIVSSIRDARKMAEIKAKVNFARETLATRIQAKEEFKEQSSDQTITSTYTQQVTSQTNGLVYPINIQVDKEVTIDSRPHYCLAAIGVLPQLKKQ